MNRTRPIKYRWRCDYLNRIGEICTAYSPMFDPQETSTIPEFERQMFTAQLQARGVGVSRLGPEHWRMVRSEIP